MRVGNLFQLTSSFADIWHHSNDIVPLNPFKPQFTIVIFIHYKPRIAVEILDL